LLATLQECEPGNGSVVADAVMLLVSPAEWGRQLGVIALDRLDSSTVQEDRFATWFLAAANADCGRALDAVERRLSALSTEAQQNVVCQICAALVSRGRGPKVEERLAGADYLRPQSLRRLIPFVYRYVRPEDDIDRVGQGVFHPSERD